ncbi:MAG: quinone-dependent dihydroorotate dehydrogenase [Candidatus Vogelbacteria bacterium]|nr:quinone-dependent dihydroorotate dehydrogenase [Candidatus Vogelbacteria bacterium]
MSLKHKVIGSLYRSIVKPVAFQFDAEKVHDAFTAIGESLEGFLPIVRAIFATNDEGMEREVLGIKFKNPVGLAAGFDYNGHLAEIMSSIGFGFNTVGTVTAKPYAGNPLPRLKRLPKSKSLFVNKGFKSEGAEAIAKRLDKKQLDGHTVGVSVGSSNVPEVNTISKAIEDYSATFNIFKDKKYASYFELNISCPNTNMPESFQDLKNFDLLIREVAKLKIDQPIFVKMPNEIDIEKSNSLVRMAITHGIRGFIFSNLAKDRTNICLDKDELASVANLKGNFSGKPTERSGNILLRKTRKTFGKDVALIGCGGVFNTEDAKAKFDTGADLVQLITGMVYMGPQITGKINSELSCKTS